MDLGANKPLSVAPATLQGYEANRKYAEALASTEAPNDKQPVRVEISTAVPTAKKPAKQSNRSRQRCRDAEVRSNTTAAVPGAALAWVLTPVVSWELPRAV